MSLEQSSISRVFLNQILINMKCQQVESMFFFCQELEVQMFGWSIRDLATCPIKVDSEGVGLGREGFIGSEENFLYCKYENDHSVLK